ncbi:phasin family protein [Roseomonas sp. M0104]|uniref:Phasin family protein n=1 Tax=Teichococcus coralli TaxID=2545983 RepID=A0A845BIL2_9PROT|nr:phasin family protein [Pseudoroseomonas coralli]MXP66006.1 phasin family protein [Pseudoroseomonas coralli]
MANESKAGKTAPEKPAIAAAPAPMEKTAKAALAAAEPAQDVAGKMIEESGAQTRTAMEKNMEKATRTAEGLYKATEEAMEFGRGNFEAFTKATQTYVSGMQELSKQAFAAMQVLNEQAVQNARAMSSVKSLKEAADLQSTFAKVQLEKSMSEATKLSEAAFKLAEQSAAPLAARMTLAMERMTRPAAFV